MAEKPFRPMLADNKPITMEELVKRNHFPLLMSTKLDGIRASVKDGVLVSRTLKPIRNVFLQSTFGRPEFEGLDGELICGDPTDPNVYQKTYSAVMTHGCDTPVHWYLFDDFSHPEETYKERFFFLQSRIAQMQGDALQYRILLAQIPVNNVDDVLRYEELIISMGYEGCMLRRPDRGYKFNRSTNSEGYLIKLKRVEISEALVIGLEEKMHNANEATIDARGYTHRTTHKDNKVGLGTLGAMVVKDLKTGDVFRIGVFKGLDDADKKEIFDNPDKYVNRAIVRYKHFPVGRVELPRHPRYFEWGGFRDPDDLDIGSVLDMVKQSKEGSE